MYTSKKKLILKTLIALGLIFIAVSLYTQYGQSYLIEKQLEKSDLEKIENIQFFSDLIQSTSFSQNTSTIKNEVFLSIPSNSEDCNDVNLPELGSGWKYRCSTQSNYQKTNGEGWIPFDFSTSTESMNVRRLSDKANSLDSYFAFIPAGIKDGKLLYSLSTKLESKKYLSKNAKLDNGIDINKFEVGNKRDILAKAEGLIAYFPFDDTSIPDAAKNSSQETQSIDLPVDDLYSSENCLLGSCLKNERDSTIRINFSSFANEIKNEPFSYGFWFKISKPPTQNVQLFNPGVDRLDVNIEGNSGAIFVWFYNNEKKGSLVYKSASQEFTNDKWHQLYVVKASDSITTYIDGKQIQKLRSALPINQIIELASINLPNGVSIDEFRFYNRPLNKEEVLKEYSSLSGKK